MFPKGEITCFMLENVLFADAVTIAIHRTDTVAAIAAGTGAGTSRHPIATVATRVRRVRRPVGIARHAVHRRRMTVSGIVE